MRRLSLAAALLLAGTGAAQAQTAPASAPAAQAALDPARVAAAQQLLAVMMPPEQRSRLMEGMIRPMMANIRQSLQQMPGFADTPGKDAKAASAMERFLKRQEDRMIETLHAGMPGMMDAMAHAYARRFDVAQIADIRAFFETPSGKAYLAASYTIMSDPDILAWQRDLMSRSVAHVQEDMASLVADLSASKAAEPK